MSTTPSCRGQRRRQNGSAGDPVTRQTSAGTGSDVEEGALSPAPENQHHGPSLCCPYAGRCEFASLPYVGGPSFGWSTKGAGQMLDLAYLCGGLGFFALLALYARVADRL
jgi:hypothetical protein